MVTMMPTKRRRKGSKKESSITCSVKASSVQQRQQRAKEGVVTLCGTGAEQTVNVFVETADDDRNGGAVTIVRPEPFPNDIMVRKTTSIVTAETPGTSEAITHTVDNNNTNDDCAPASWTSLLQQLWRNVESHTNGTGELQPTPIQLQTWSILLSPSSSSCSATITPRHDLIAIAPTGSGKTLAYGLSILLQLGTSNGTGNGKGRIGAVCLLPTRELALQVEKDLKLPCRHNRRRREQGGISPTTSPLLTHVKIVSIYGGNGVDRDNQIQALHQAKQYPVVVVATPGRLLDLLEERSDLRKLCSVGVEFLVLDEADRLAGDLDMCEQIDKIRVLLPTNVRTCLFSATKKKSVSKKWNEWVRKPRIVVKVGVVVLNGKTTKTTATKMQASKAPIDEPAEKGRKSQDLDVPDRKRQKIEGDSIDVARIPSHVTQTLHVLPHHDKKPQELLSRIAQIRLTQSARNKSLSIVFFAQIKTLQSVMKFLLRKGIRSCSEYHGKLSQVQRERALADFRSGKCTILLATDMAARGIHVNHVEYVINYDFPESLDEYVHRCGRAGRPQKHGKPMNGTVYSFVTTTDLTPTMAGSVIELLRASNAWLDPKLIAMTV
jgi:superfamily II DNA/RNA helicase